MATIYRTDGTTEPIDGDIPSGALSLVQCQRLVGFHYQWLCLRVNLLMLISTNAADRGLDHNLAASRIAGRAVHGDAVLVPIRAQPVGVRRLR